MRIPRGIWRLIIRGWRRRYPLMGVKPRNISPKYRDVTPEFIDFNEEVR